MLRRPPGVSRSDPLFPYTPFFGSERRGIACTGSGSVLAFGDAVLPEHGLGIANGYDDCYHLTPARVVRQVVGLGYRGDVVHYVGMSHYMRLAAAGGGLDRKSTRLNSSH